MKPVVALLTLQVFATFATAATMIFVPAAIPGSFGIHITAQAYPLCYLFAAEEFALGILSLVSMSIRDAGALRKLLFAFAAFHGATALAVIYSVITGAPMALLANGAAHLVVLGLFVTVILRTPGLRPDARIAAAVPESTRFAARN